MDQAEPTIADFKRIIEQMREERRQMYMTIASLSSRPTQESYNALVTQLMTVARQLDDARRQRRAEKMAGVSYVDGFADEPHRQQMTFAGSKIIPIEREERGRTDVEYKKSTTYRFPPCLQKVLITPVENARQPTKAEAIPLNALRFSMGGGKPPRLEE